MEELPQLPDIRAGHACSQLPLSGVSNKHFSTHIPNVQALVVAGGNNGSINFASVLTFFPGTDAWTALTSLPRSLYGARALIIAGRLRLTGGRDDGGAYRSEVGRTFLPWTFVHLPLEPDYHVVLHDQIRYWSTIRIPGTPGSRSGISQLAEHFILSWLLGLSMLPVWQVKNMTQNLFVNHFLCIFI